MKKGDRFAHVYAKQPLYSCKGVEEIFHGSDVRANWF